MDVEVTNTSIVVEQHSSSITASMTSSSLTVSLGPMQQQQQPQQQQPQKRVAAATPQASLQQQRPEPVQIPATSVAQGIQSPRPRSARNANNKYDGGDYDLDDGSTPKEGDGRSRPRVRNPRPKVIAEAVLPPVLSRETSLHAQLFRGEEISTPTFSELTKGKYSGDGAWGDANNGALTVAKEEEDDGEPEEITSRAYFLRHHKKNWQLHKDYRKTVGKIERQKTGGSFNLTPSNTASSSSSSSSSSLPCSSSSSTVLSELQRTREFPQEVRASIASYVFPSPSDSSDASEPSKLDTSSSGRSADNRGNRKRRKNDDAWQQFLTEQWSPPAFDPHTQLFDGEDEPVRETYVGYFNYDVNKSFRDGRKARGSKSRGANRLKQFFQPKTLIRPLWDDRFAVHDTAPPPVLRRSSNSSTSYAVAPGSKRAKTSSSSSSSSSSAALPAPVTEGFMSSYHPLPPADGPPNPNAMVAVCSGGGNDNEEQLLHAQRYILSSRLFYQSLQAQFLKIKHKP